MADSFKFELVSPERLLMSGGASQVIVPGSEGDFTVLPGHAPVLSTLRPGVLDIRTEEGMEKRVYVRGGFAEAGPGELTVLAQQAIPFEELDEAAIAQEIRDLEEDVADAKDDETREKAEYALNRLRNIEAALRS